MGIKVSVVLPTYNVEKYLRKCVESIINQTLKNIEIIIVNDGSTDKSGEIAKELQSIDNRIIIINQKNKGLSQARNAGLRIAKGEYIAFIDSDDWIEKDMLFNMYNYANINNCDVVQCNYTIRNFNYYNHIKTTIPTNRLLNVNDINTYIKEPLLEGKLSTYAWDKIYKVSFLKENNLYFENIKRFEDWYFIMNVVSKMERFLILSDNFYNYRVNEGSLSRRYYDNYEELVISLQEKKYEYMKLWDMNKGVYLLKSIKNLGEDILNIINYIFDPRYQLSKIEKIRKLERIINNDFLRLNLYNSQYKDYIKESKINKIYLSIIFYALKYKNSKIIYFLKSIY